MKILILALMLVASFAFATESEDKLEKPKDNRPGCHYWVKGECVPKP